MDKVSYKNWLGIIGLGLIAFMGFLDVTIVSNVLPPIQTALNATNVQLQWLLNAIFMCMAASMAVLGALGDHFGKRLILFGAVALFLIASLGAGLSHTINQLIIFRMLQGLSIGSLSLTMALATQSMPRHLQARASSVFTAIAGSGMAFGPVIGGLLVHWLNWRWIFLINIPIVVTGLFITWLTVKELNYENNHEYIFDWKGALLLSITMGLLMFALLQTEAWGWLSFKTISLILLSILIFILFILNENYSKEPLLRFDVLKKKMFLIAILACLTQGICIGVILFLNPIYLQFIQNRNVIISGLLLFCISSMLVLFSPIAGWFTHRFGAKQGCILLALITALSVLMQSFFTVNASEFFIAIAFILFGMGWCLANIAPTVATINSIPSDKIGGAMGLLWTLFSFSSAIGLAILGTVFRNSTQHKLTLLLQQQHLQLNTKQLRMLHDLLIQPNHNNVILSNFSKESIVKITSLFKTSFMYGFHEVMITLFFASLFMLFFIVFKF